MTRWFDFSARLVVAVSRGCFFFFYDDFRGKQSRMERRRLSGRQETKAAPNIVVQRDHRAFRRQEERRDAVHQIIAGPRNAVPKGEILNKKKNFLVRPRVFTISNKFRG